MQTLDFLNHYKLMLCYVMLFVNWICKKLEIAFFDQTKLA